MNFLLSNIRTDFSSISENALDNILKEAAFGSKVKGKTELNYNFILIPILEKKEEQKDMSFVSLLEGPEVLNENDIVSIGSFLKWNTLPKNTKIEIFSRISEDNIDIFYSDGSFSKAEGKSSYAVCKLLNESENGIEDLFSRKKVEYEIFSGELEDSTNNIGELTGIKIVSQNFGDNQFQLVISDSEYSIKSFREWIHNWKHNGFRTYSKKPIANKSLIQEIFSNLTSKEKIVLFKWTKGHNKDNFNEICDSEAKRILGIVKKK